MDASGRFRAAPGEPGIRVPAAGPCSQRDGCRSARPLRAGRSQEGDLDRLLGPATRLALENRSPARGELLAKMESTPTSRRGSWQPATRRAPSRNATCGPTEPRPALLAVLYEAAGSGRTARGAGEDEAADALPDQHRGGGGEICANLHESAHGSMQQNIADAGLRGRSLRSLADTADVPGSITR